MLAGVGIDERLGLSRSQQHELIREAARLGFDSLWTPTGATARSTFLTCYDWWQVSASVVPEGLRVGVSVVPFPAWTVATLAAQAASVGELTGGKFILGIGLGAYPAQRFRASLDLQNYPSVTYTREYLTTLQTVLRGEPLDFSGSTTISAGPSSPSRRRKSPCISQRSVRRCSAPLASSPTASRPTGAPLTKSQKLREHVASATPDGEQRPFAQYIRVCVDEDEDAARRAFVEDMLGYALARPGQPKDRGYRADFARMGFDDALSDLSSGSSRARRWRS